MVEEGKKTGVNKWCVNGGGQLQKIGKLKKVGGAAVKKMIVAFFSEGIKAIV